ncbi:hypothetical protein LSH36_155g01044 [Paralvinella palmiformis]|uniref:PiggyBac transposable element-derived protein domain-containing protein n=1 Tax=Paralvinella palmiformis TaxID=53620 RepID=A0AAD9JVL4_9ANNE|nr:hypothetical protein LSH36_155g01044 [Paralvinella palmiformis]
MAASTSASDLSFDFAFDTDSEEEFGGFDSFDVEIAEKLVQDRRRAFDRESDDDFSISDLDISNSESGDSSSDDETMPVAPHECDWTDNLTDYPDIPFINQASVGVDNAEDCCKMSAEQLFGIFFTDYLFRLIVGETNRYAGQCRQHEPKKGRKHSEWYEVTVPELKTWLGLLLTMGLVQKKGRLGEYWLTHNLTQTPGFSVTMPRNRFLQILRYLHFVNNEDSSINKENKFIELMTKLEEENTLSCGTVNQNRSGLPKDAKKTCAVVKSLKRGDSLKRMKGRMLAVTWRDTQIVNVLCNVPGYLGDGAVRRRDRKGAQIIINRPSAIELYNTFMGGVDLSNQRVSSYRRHMKSLTWYLQVFFHIVQLSGVQAYLLHKEMNPEKSNNQFGFFLELIDGLVAGRSFIRKHHPSSSRPATDIRLNRELEHSLIKHETQSKCAVHTRRVDTLYACGVCKSLSAVSLRPKPEGCHVIQQNDTSYGIPNTMIDGFKNVKNDLTQDHPLEYSEKQWKENQSSIDFRMLRNTQGLHAPLRLRMERFAARQVERLPCLHSSNLMMDTLTGKLDTIEFDDILNNPMDSEVMGQPHAMVERKLGLL